MAKAEATKQAPRSGGRRKKPPTEFSRAELLKACEQLRASLLDRRKIRCAIPRRGYSPDPTVPRMPLVYRIPSCGAAEVLRLLTEGKLEVISTTLVDALIAELSRTP
jgi:hypothetical protein